VLAPREARSLVAAAERIFYQERTWERTLAETRLPPRSLERWRGFAASGLPDLKALDAREVIRAAAHAHVAPRPAPREPPPSALVRRRRLEATGEHPKGDAGDGVRRALIAAFARSLGLRAPASSSRLAEDVALERLAVEYAERLVSDGPSRWMARALGDGAQAPRGIDGSPGRGHRTRAGSAFAESEGMARAVLRK